LVIAALWSAHNLPAELARQMVVERLHAASSISQSSRAKVLLSRLSTEVSSQKQFDLRPFLEQLLALSSDTSPDSPSATGVLLTPRARSHTASSQFERALFQRPPPPTFLS
jgi:hypothetical protein